MSIPHDVSTPQAQQAPSPAVQSASSPAQRVSPPQVHEVLPPHALPPELRKLLRWVVWSFEITPGKTKKRKVPRSPWSPYPFASSTRSETWGALGQARDALARRASLGGLGFVFAADDDILGIDLDDVFDGDVLHPAAAEIVAALDSYTERSPSGGGLHIIVRGSWFAHNVVELPFRIEVYAKERFFTVTGAHLTGTPLSVNARDGELLRFEERFFPPKAPLPASPAVWTAPSGPLEDMRVVELMLKCRNAVRLERLLAGDPVGAGYIRRGEGGRAEGDHSRADIALCNALYYFSGGNRAQVDRLFRSSNLYRPKWDRKAHGDGRSYGELTIDAVARSAQKVRVA